MYITSLFIYFISNKKDTAKSNKNTIKNGTEVIENNIIIDKTKLNKNKNEVKDNLINDIILKNL